ncbi:LamG-like jellyroll fold domain-containing protein [Extensimonas vulgaris]|uniref:Concanavalin A-like lectin/glucanase superfamily protein n=1 Tax=Extensimonas vulgaris TaxID=1031594 RepID=A0A369ANR3_9BURK|nr:LamG-like jellyroll fold domain-containing protein [Extensimonas vulgaris]RCX10693.1 concanavalin A-like lectin/glucanase superfamily protein [Extensimonas vulgaris]TWI41335.1 concanavalin A-like lectin/glucanase superfamily protein [Extensimonas vulgaris]
MACNKSYRDMIIADGAAYFWDFNDQPAATAAPTVPTVGGVALNVFGSPSAQPFTGDTKALMLNGSSQCAGINQPLINNTNCSIEEWIKTSSKYGGIFGANNSGNNQTPTAYDKHCYLNSAGNIVFGVYSGGKRSDTSITNVCDNEHHHVVLSFSNNSTTLYIDGATEKTINYVSSDSGKYPVFGYVYASTWSGYVSPWLNGLLACPAIYNFAMTPEMAMRHYQMGMQCL